MATRTLLAPRTRSAGAALGAGAVLMAALLSPAAAAPEPQTVRDIGRPPVAAAPLPPGNGSIAGVVVSDDAAAAPIRRAAVTVTTTDGRPAKTVYTDDAGRFSVSGLPAGRYLVAAMKSAFVRAAYGARRADRPGTPVSVADGQAVGNLALRMARGAVITGRITDETGQPVPGCVVRVSQPRVQNGERTLAPVVALGGAASDMTDDRGTYRLFGLAPGDYVVAAAPRLTPGGEIRQTTPSDIESVERALQAASAPGRGQNTAPPAPDPVTVAYATVFYPSTPNPANAATLTLAAGEERSGIDLSMQLVRTARIEGVVITPEGIPPQSVQLMLVSSGATVGLPMQMMLNRIAPGPDGKFSYSGIAPGQYTISATATASGGNGANANGGVSSGMRMTMPAGTAGGPSLWGQADVAVNGENVSGVTVTLQPGMTLTGRVAVEAVGVDPPDVSRARITLAPSTMANGMMIGIPIARLDPSGRFTMTGVTPGKFRMSASLSTPEANWTVKSILFKGRDVMDVPLEVAPNEDLSNVVVTFTNQTQELSGTLQDVTGRPAPDYTIVVFPADPALRSSARRVKTARPATDGRFVVADLPAGAYQIAAVVDIAPSEASDVSFLEEIARTSIAVTIGPGQKKVQDLKIAGGGH